MKHKISRSFSFQPVLIQRPNSVIPTTVFLEKPENTSASKEPAMALTELNDHKQDLKRAASSE